MGYIYLHLTGALRNRVVNRQGQIYAEVMSRVRPERKE